MIVVKPILARIQQYAQSQVFFFSPRFGASPAQEYNAFCRVKRTVFLFWNPEIIQVVTTSSFQPHIIVSQAKLAKFPSVFAILSVQTWWSHLY